VAVDSREFLEFSFLRTSIMVLVTPGKPDGEGIKYLPSAATQETEIGTPPNAGTVKQAFRFHWRWRP